jgi:hypothetical protein
MATNKRTLGENLIIVGKMALGAGLLYEGFKLVTTPSGLGQSPTQRGVPPGAQAGPLQRDLQRIPLGKATSGNGILKSGRVINIKGGDIAKRVAYIRDFIRKGSVDPRVIEVKAKVLSRKCGDNWCVQPKNAIAEITALFNAVHDPRSPYAMRYAKDHVYIDQFTHPERLLRLHSGDCDDGSSLLGALYLCAGYPVKMRVVQTTNAQSWSHIYLLVNTADKANRWIPVDWSVEDAKVGWEVPSSQVSKVRDFDV